MKWRKLGQRMRQRYCVGIVWFGGCAVGLDYGTRVLRDTQSPQVDQRGEAGTENACGVGGAGHLLSLLSPSLPPALQTSYL